MGFTPEPLLPVRVYSIGVDQEIVTWPVPLPLPTSFGGAQSYIDQLSVQLKSCDPSMLIYPPEIGAMCAEASRQCGVKPDTNPGKSGMMLEGLAHAHDG